MERKYFEIDEGAARLSHENMSFRDYKEGSKTAEYLAYVDDVYDLAESVAQKYPEAEEKAWRIAERYARRLAENMNKDSRIGCMCPSVMISGAGNFPVKKKQKQVEAWERNHKDWQEVQNIVQQLERMLRKGEVILSDDEDALGKLQRKADDLRKKQEEMKEVNKALRIKNPEKANERLREMGYTDTQIEELRKPDFLGRIGYPGYALTNNNANIHRIEQRIKELTEAQEKGTKETENDLYKVIENTELMRLQIVFDGKPEEHIREVLKRNGFRWAPSQGAWQRQLTSAARSALRTVERELGVQ